MPTSDVPTSDASRQPIPWRIIFAAIFSVLAVVVGLFLVMQAARIITWMFIAAFFAIVLTPAVDFLHHRARLPRGLSIVVVFLVGLLLAAAMLYAFIRPLVDETRHFADNFSEYVTDARAGRGTIGELVKRYNLDQRLDQNRAKLNASLTGLGQNSLKIVRSIGNVVAGGLTIMVLTVLMLLEGPRMLESGLGALSPPKRERVRRVAADCARAVSGYVAGNLLISLIAGVATYGFLLIAGVPFAAVLGLWVAFTDLIPLVGATLGAVVVLAVAFIHSVPAGIAALIFYIIYQQFENHVLQVTIMAKTVALNPLVVLVSVLLGVELFGLLGALLSIPVAGVIQVVARDIWDERQGRLKAEPTIGVDEVPSGEVRQIS